MDEFYGEPVGLKEYLTFQRIKNSIMNKYIDARPGSKEKNELKAQLDLLMLNN